MGGNIRAKVQRLRRVASRSSSALVVTSPRNEMRTKEERYIPGARIVYTGKTKSGIRITPDNAVTISAVWACIRFLSQSIASLPWAVLDDRTKKPVSNSVPAQRIIDRPSDEFSSFQFRETFVHWALRWGNAYAEIEFDEFYRPKALHPIHPERVAVFRDPAGDLFYIVDGVNGSAPVMLQPFEMFHIRGMGEGPVGLNVIAYAAESLGWTKAVQMFGAGFFGEGATPAGVVTTKKPLTPEGLSALKKEFQKVYSGAKNAGKTAFLDNDMEYKPLTVDPDKGQFIETNQFLIDEVCFVPGTEILTASGVRAIENVRAGDLVLTHKGRWRPVKHVMSRDYVGEVVTLKGKGLSQVTATTNHPFYVQPVKPTRAHRVEVDGEAVFKDAGSLVAERRQADGRRARGAYDCLTMPRLQRDANSIVDLITWSPGAFPSSVEGKIQISLNHRATEVNRFPIVGHDLGYLCGLFAADGSATDHQTIFYLGSHETEIIERTRTYLTSVFGVDCSVTPKGTVTRVVVSNEVVANFFSQFGCVAHEKHFSDWCMQASEDFHNGLIDGVVDGDGCYYKKDTLLRTTSKHLVNQVRCLLWSFAMNSGVEHTEAGTWSIEGRTGVSRESWTVRWRDNGERRGTMGVADDRVFFTLNRVEKSNYEGVVHNLEVEEDESYVTVGGTVHNCRWFGVPPHKIYKLLNATFSNIEHQSIEVVQDSLIPWARRFEDETKFKLLGQNRAGYTNKFNMNALLRGDTKTRLEYYRGLREIGVFHADDIRALEDMPLIGDAGGGEKRVMQSQYTTLERIGEEPVTPPTGTAGRPVAPEPDPVEPDEGDDGDTPEPAEDTSAIQKSIVRMKVARAQTDFMLNGAPV